MTPSGPVGIEKLRVYPSSMALEMTDLCAARGHDPADMRDTMLIDQRSVAPVYEDPVTLAVNAANPMLSDDDRRSIELLIVGTESGVDQEKPISTWVHRYLGLNANCRNFELKHACYSGTAGLSMAAAWIASGLAGDAKALVITTDQSRMHLGKPYEFVMGAGAAAVLVSGQPHLLELELGKSGYFTNEVSDLTRPTSRVETGNSETSLLSYLDGLHGAYSHYVERVGGQVDFETFFKNNVYHVPFGGITFLAHKELLRRDRRVGKQEAWDHFARRSLPALRYARRMGGTYSSSTFVALLGLLDSAPDLAPGDRLGIFSYGSGSCAEFYSALVGAHAHRAAREAGLERLLDERYLLSVAEYEAIERERTARIDDGDFDTCTAGFGDWYDRHYRGRGYLVFRGMREHYRRYEWS
jgi:3-hydroxy-3-methylglutaryl CoA synthase